MKKKKSTIIIVLGCLLVCASLVLFSVFNNNSNNNNSNVSKKDNGLEYNGWVFKLPKDWKDNGTNESGRSVNFSNKVDNDILGLNGVHFNIVSSKKMNSDMAVLFSESSPFIKMMEETEYIKVEEHKIVQHNNKPVMIFPFKLVNNESSLAYRVFTPADDEYYYDFQLFSNRIIDGQDEMFYNFDAVLLFVDFLNSGVKE